MRRSLLLYPVAERYKLSWVSCYFLGIIKFCHVFPLGYWRRKDGNAQKQAGGQGESANAEKGDQEGEERHGAWKDTSQDLLKPPTPNPKPPNPEP